MHTKGRPLTGTQKKIRKTVFVEPQHVEILGDFIKQLSDTKLIPGELPKKLPIPTDKEQQEAEDWERYCEELANEN